jgi:hypothetical protein
MSFTSTKAIYQALIQGNVIENKSGIIVSLDDNGNQAVFNSFGIKCPQTFKLDDPENWGVRKEMITVNVETFAHIFLERFDFNGDAKINLEWLITALRCRDCVK